MPFFDKISVVGSQQVRAGYGLHMGTRPSLGVCTCCHRNTVLESVLRVALPKVIRLQCVWCSHVRVSCSSGTESNDPTAAWDPTAALESVT